MSFYFSVLMQPSQVGIDKVGTFSNEHENRYTIFFILFINLVLITESHEVYIQ